MKKMKFRPKLKPTKEEKDGWRLLYFMKGGHLIRLWKCN